MTIKLVLSTECRNDGHTHTVEECDFDKTSTRTFHVVVISQPWLTPPMHLQSFHLVDQTTSTDNIVKDSDAETKKLSVEEILKTSSQEFNDFLTKFRPSYLEDAKGKIGCC